MDARGIIREVRDTGSLPADAARWFARGLADGTVDDAQAGAFAMAVLLRGIGEEGRVALTCAMRDSGSVLSWDLPGPVVDKHSTGGVGDAVSLLLAPALAACGAYVPMISGRGLGHTGGTLDKMESIPGYRTDIDRATLDKALRDAGCAIIGATDDIAPADRRLYAIRDISGTVESVDLITASILSKKLAAGLGALVLDVKCGSGAFMPDLAQARELARALVGTANAAGCRTSALITDMNSPLAKSAGNAVEVAEVVACLTDPASWNKTAMWQVTLALGAEALWLSELATTPEQGAEQINQALHDGRAAERFGRMVAALGGPTDLLEHPARHLAQAPAQAGALPRSTADCYVQAVDTRAIGELVVKMGGGRLRSGQTIDHSVGFDQLARKGDRLTRDQAVGRAFAPDAACAKQAFENLAACYSLTDQPVTPDPLILDRIGPEEPAP